MGFGVGAQNVIVSRHRGGDALQIQRLKRPQNSIEPRNLFRMPRRCHMPKTGFMGD
jgi:hypothetical protein